jgi:hypothetical protein
MFVKACREGERNAVELFKDPKALAHQTHRAITKAEGEIIGPFAQARGIVAGKAVAFAEEQEKIARQKRIEAEAVAKAEAETLALAEAAAAHDAGDSVAAMEILDEALTAPAPVVQVKAEVAKVEGVSSTKRWSAQVTSLAALVKWVALNPESIHLLKANDAALNSMARAQKEAMRIPGVRAVSTTTLGVRG